MNTLSKTLRLFLDSIGRRSEYEFYLKKFQADRSPCFAIVAPDTDSIRDSGDLMIFDLHFLLRLGLCPLVVLCGGEAQATAEELARHGAVEMLGPEALAESDEELSARFAACIREERIPVLVDAATPLADWMPQACPRLAGRVHLLRAAGMLHDPEGERLFYVYVNREDGLTLAEGDRVVADMAAGWLRQVPGLHVSVSSPLYLLQEMFTVKGRGSILRKGSQIDQFTDLSTVDLDRVAGLMEQAFGRKLVSTDCLAAGSDLYLEAGYRGAVLLESHAAGNYLSKFAVGTEARGEGLAQELWDTACAPQERLFWRSRTGNPVNHWYERHATGHHRDGAWTVFWKGIPASDLPGIIATATSRPSDFRS